MKTARFDPTRTTMLRNKFANEMTRRFNRLMGEIISFVVVKDAFALTPYQNKFVTHAEGEERQFEFLNNPTKLAAFRKWLRDQIRRGLLSDKAPAGRAWTSDYVESAYLKGIASAYANARKKKYGAPEPLYEGTRAEFLAQTFSSPITKERLELLYTRAFNQLEGITDAMDAQISAVLASGLAHGIGAAPLAQELNSVVSGIGMKRAILFARTELIHSYAEGQLDSFERLGIEELGLIVEWRTTRTPSVCPKCQAMDGKTFTIAEARGLIPKHPLCRCSFTTIRKSARITANRRRSMWVRSAA